ncbi:LysR family transcriptional regulator [Comamonas sp. Tr-654]|uniref:LysR family transcriptional regulator n=1 Tax=Comamonas sp. Tr-654 TaxID=2608341 RepID=UPI0014203FA6|nr:LysR family transcriptional regulator [Comamonas sp. Tr-654]NIF85801.1 LysR family transcriptional regulator [Comamonas sp. Tr-654]
MDKLLALKAFVDVAETQGFSKAARRMGVATSSVTRLIDALEESLGSALLTRSTRLVSLTDTGAVYLEQVRRVLSELEEADGSIADSGAEAVGPLRISMPVTYGRLYLGPHIAAFLNANPRVSVELVLSDAYVDLLSERIDVAIRIGTPASSPQLVVKKLAEHHRFVVASQEYLASAAPIESPADLTQHECLRFAYQAGVQRWSFTKQDVTQHVEVGGRLTANNSEVLREAVLSGFGVALLPEWLVHDDVRSGRVRRLFEDYAVNPREQSVSVYAAYLPNRRFSRKVQALLSFLQDHVALTPLTGA